MTSSTGTPGIAARQGNGHLGLRVPVVMDAPVSAHRWLFIAGASAASTFKPDALGTPGRPTTSDPVFVAASLAELTLTITTRRPDDDAEESIWAAITDAAALLIAGTELAGVTVNEHSRPAHPPACAAASGAVQLLTKAHNDTGEGPCLDATRCGEQVLIRDLHTDTRWPRFTARAPWTLHSMLCTPLIVAGATVGVVMALSTRAWAFDDTSARLATVVAAHAGLALAHLQQTRNLHAAANSRDVIGQATGILMQRHHLSADQAFRKLTHASQNSSVELHTVCQHVADTVDLSAPTTGINNLPQAPEPIAGG